VPELRRDPVVERWVVIATERARRPSDYAPAPPPTPSGEACPFCPGQEDRTPPELLRIGGPEGWTVRVFPNKFPALRIEGAADATGDGIYDRMTGVGAHEVIVESPRHRDSLGAMAPARVAEVLGAYRSRLRELRRDPRLAYVLVFKNRGPAAGASLEHPHSQLIATPIVPEQVAEELAAAERYYLRKERCVWCDIVRQERRNGTRIVAVRPGFLAVSPWAPRVPFETLVLPTRHQAAFQEIDDQGLAGLADILADLVGRYDRVLADPPYNFALHTAPLRADDLDHYHWHLEVTPTLTQVAGFEWGSGFFINATPPEDAARFLREGAPGSRAEALTRPAAPGAMAS
jgi:UDPglucose--hexose-1-phosphate uridylyltransferase